jgi:hypothetical protein
MLILNRGKKDYYDGVVQSVGMDKTIVYEREIIEITDNKKMPEQFKHRHWTERRENRFSSVCRADVDKKKTKKYVDVRGFVVGFCGKLYLGWKFKFNRIAWDENIKSKVELTQTDIIYGYENAKQYLKADYWGSNLADEIKYIESYDPIDLFRKNKTPIFVYDTEKRDDVFIVNANLKDYEFYRVIDAFTAFTELQMFISGVLGTGEKEIIEVEDRYKIGQHGFDKWSFRKEPSKKR